MSSVRVEKITRLKVPPEYVKAVQVDKPVRGDSWREPLLEIAGWVIGESTKPLTLDIFHKGQRIRAMPINLPRSDVTSRFNDAPGADKPGFAGLLSVVGLPQTFIVELVLHMGNGHRIPVATLHGRRKFVSPNLDVSLQPLMVTTLGRTGSTWLMNLLSRHPQVVVRDQYPFESKAAKYWLQTLKLLSEPAPQPSNAPRIQADRWWLGPNPYFALSLFHENKGSILGIDSLAGCVMHNIDAWYTHMARAQSKSEAKYYSEKFEPNLLPPLVHELYPAAREVFLVRDPRDWACSILAFDKKRGFYGFGREKDEPTHEYVHRLRNRAMMLYGEFRLRSEMSYLLRYEDLVKDCEKTLVNLFTYLDVNSSGSVVRKVIDEASAQSEKYRTHRTTAAVQQSIGRWNQLEASLQELIVNALTEPATKFGYPDTSHRRSHNGRSDSERASRPMVKAE